MCAILDPDRRWRGTGVDRLRAAGIDVTVGVLADEVTAQLRPYLHHRLTGRPFVVLKLASTLDGRTAAADGSSMWITGEAARTEVHRLRAESDAIVVGAATVRADDPSLTVRHVDGPDPRRVVLGRAPAHARVHPAWSGRVTSRVARPHSARTVCCNCSSRVARRVASSFHHAGLVDRYVVHLAPALMGGDDGRPVLSASVHTPSTTCGAAASSPPVSSATTSRSSSNPSPSPERTCHDQPRESVRAHRGRRRAIARARWS